MQHSRLNRAPELGQVLDREAREVQEGLVDGVDFEPGRKSGQHIHHAGRHLLIQGIVGRIDLHAVLTDELLVLEERLTPFQSELFRLTRERHNAAIVIGKHDGGPVVQCCLKNPLAGDIKTGAIDQGNNMCPHRTR